MEKSGFCRMVQDFTVLSDDKAGDECREEIRTRKLFGGLIEY
jgi:hypothetical protein